MVRAQSSGPGDVTLSYTWTANGGSVVGSGAEARWNPSATPGTYTVSLHVDDGRGATGDCSSDIGVEQKIHQPPTMVCSADRSSVAAGEPVRDDGYGQRCGARDSELLLERERRQHRRFRIFGEA